MASGRPCYNLDGWMTNRGYVRQLFARATSDADIAIIEGVMGLFDGASPTTLEGSTAEVAKWLDAPVLLVVNAHGAARSLAATAKGFATFEPGVCVAGVIANQAGTDRHRSWVEESLRGAELPPLVGAVPRGGLPTLASRHLGLVTAGPKTCGDETIKALADACEKHVQLDRIAGLARAAKAVKTATPECVAVGRKIRVGIASDEAFHFYYADNLEMLQLMGVEWVPFSPLRDEKLPEDLQGLYIGGGYPELYAGQLGANEGMLEDVRRFAASSRPVYAECGGLMYLGRGVKTLDEKRIELAGVAPVETEMLKSLRTLGYVEATLKEPSLWGEAGTVLRGHEFHYSRICRDELEAKGWERVYSIRRRRKDEPEEEGFQKGNVLASYVHLHFASQPDVMKNFFLRCEETR